MNEFAESTLEELAKHGLRALRDTLPNETELTTKNCSVGIVGKDDVFTVFEDEEVARFLAGIETAPRKRGAAAAADTAAPAAASPMDAESAEGTAADPTPAEPQVDQPMDQQ